MSQAKRNKPGSVSAEVAIEAEKLRVSLTSILLEQRESILSEGGWILVKAKTLAPSQLPGKQDRSWKCHWGCCNHTLQSHHCDSRSCSAWTSSTAKEKTDSNSWARQAGWATQPNWDNPAMLSHPQRHPGSLFSKPTASPALTSSPLRPTQTTTAC